MRNGAADGIGHPEPLKGTSGKYSRKIDDTNRLVYSLHDDGTVVIHKCKGHYDDK